MPSIYLSVGSVNRYLAFIHSGISLVHVEYCGALSGISILIYPRLVVHVVVVVVFSGSSSALVVFSGAVQVAVGGWATCFFSW